jgi:hypothetical protein
MAASRIVHLSNLWALVGFLDFISRAGVPGMDVTVLRAEAV